METAESTEESRSLDAQPSSEGLQSTSEPILSSSGSPRSPRRSGAVTAPDVLCGSARRPYPVLTEHSSDSLLEATCPGSRQIGHGRFGYQPLYVSYVPRKPCATDHSSTPAPTSSYPCCSSDHSSGPCSGSGSGPTSGPAPAPEPAPAPAPEPAPAPKPADSEPKVSASIPQWFRSIPPDLLPWSQYCYYEPYQQPWEPLQVGEPGVRGPWKPPGVERKPELCKILPRGQCLLYNWEEERATNHLDQIPRLQDGSESYFFRHGHQGLLSTQFQSPMPSSTIQKDSYRPPRYVCQPLRGEREARLERLLHHQIWVTSTPLVPPGGGDILDGHNSPKWGLLHDPNVMKPVLTLRDLLTRDGASSTPKSSRALISRRFWNSWYSGFGGSRYVITSTVYTMGWPGLRPKWTSISEGKAHCSLFFQS